VASLRMAVGEVATRDFIRSELRALLADMDEREAERQAEHRAGGETSATSPEAGEQPGSA